MNQEILDNLRDGARFKAGPDTFMLVYIPALKKWALFNEWYEEFWYAQNSAQDSLSHMISDIGEVSYLNPDWFYNLKNGQRFRNTLSGDIYVLWHFSRDFWSLYNEKNLRIWCNNDEGTAQGAFGKSVRYFEPL